MSWEPCDACGTSEEECWNKIVRGGDPDVENACCDNCHHHLAEAVE